MILFKYFFAYRCAGAAWLSSVRVVRCLVNSLNERNPRDIFKAFRLFVKQLGKPECRRGRRLNLYGLYVIGLLMRYNGCVLQKDAKTICLSKT